MSKSRVIGTGLNGLVGSKFVQLYKDNYEFDSLDLRDPVNPVDITDLDSVKRAINSSSAEVVIHMAAFTNVTAAWEQKKDKEGLVFQVNVGGTKNIIQACRETGKHLIHISTAYVFDGEKEGLYSETDEPNPIEWYGETKYLAEQAVMSADISWSILRIDQPFRSDKFEKTDIAHRIINGLKNDSLHPLFSDHYFGPTYIEDFSKILEFFVQHQPVGLFHATSGEKWSDYEFGQLIKQVHNLPGKIESSHLASYLKTLNRPYQKNTALDTSKLNQVLDFKPNSIEEAVKKITV